jgi:hypothetical protein
MADAKIAEPPSIEGHCSYTLSPRPMVGRLDGADGVG